MLELPEKPSNAVVSLLPPSGSGGFARNFASLLGSHLEKPGLATDLPGFLSATLTLVRR